MLQKSSGLTSKVILILSPQAWGNMLLSKHHYAIELARRGNEVYFLNPPDNHHWNWGSSRERIKIEASAEDPNLFLVNQELFFPYKLKFHARPLYNFLIKRQIRNILHSIPKPVDIIWSFDLGNLFPLSYFNNRMYKVFHPVDEPNDPNAIQAAVGADILFSVTSEIIEKYEAFGIPSYFINHGLADEFIRQEASLLDDGGQIKIGMSGNLLRPDLDERTLIQIIEENPGLSFHFYGSYRTGQSNLGGESDTAPVLFIEKLQSFKQVELHGVLKTGELAKELNRMDLLLICYDIDKDQSKGTNYHKVMEYLSTGKVIVSNNITTYNQLPELVRMPVERTSNRQLPGLFKETVQNLEKYNDPQCRERRILFARENRYKNQLDKLEHYMLKGLNGKDLNGREN
jgi:hypothetical protein